MCISLNQEQRFIKQQLSWLKKYSYSYLSEVITASFVLNKKDPAIGSAIFKIEKVAISGSFERETLRRSLFL